ncbi:acyloxyacyl hydrolase [Flavobacterium sp. W20_MBD1_R3]|uniref:acyloxyacyl hydrolase n=1 Tax=Flavobacterium sp. W20_MBD1_R3 TaxID=3240278 RepID=UPI003F9184FA
MFKKILFIAICICGLIPFYAQDKVNKTQLGFSFGLGSEFKNRNYTYANQSFKLQFYSKIKESKNFKYEIVLQPELNFATHQLLNLYFVEPDEPNYIEKREKYTTLKDVKEYVFNIGLLMRKPVFKSASIYVLASIGPMIIDNETERLSKGFAFADVLALGFTFRINKVVFDIRPTVRHISNAGLYKNNSGYNTKNIDFGVLFSL